MQLASERRTKARRERERERGGEAAMNDRNQRNTAPRKLPGIHPEYIIRTGVPAGGVQLSGSRGRSPGEEKRARDREGEKEAAVFAGTTPNCIARCM